MGLKDLIADKSAIAEEAIEAIVADFVRYDPKEREVMLTPAGADLPNKSKVLVYLVALKGWPYVVEEAVASEAKPSDLEDKLGVNGGTLRPILKDLKDRRLLTNKGDGYAVSPAGLEAIKRELGASAGSPRPASRRTVAKKKSAERTDEGAEANVKTGGSRRSPGRGSGEISENFDAWIKEGFFDEWRSLADVHQRLHENAIIVPQSTIPTYLLAAVKAKRLKREKRPVNGRTVWVYQTGPAAKAA